MIYQLEVGYRRLRRWFNRSEWMLSLLGFNKQAATDHKTGLLIIQIDGLSHQQFQTALGNNRLPFMAKLINNEHYHLHSHAPQCLDFFFFLNFFFCINLKTF